MKVYFLRIYGFFDYQYNLKDNLVNEILKDFVISFFFFI